MLQRNVPPLLLLSSAFVGAAYIFSKNGLSLFQPMQLLGFRFALGLLFFLLLAALRVIKLKKFSFHPLILLHVLLSTILYFTFEILGLQRIDSSIAAIILSAAPIFASVASAAILKESLTLRQLFFTLLAFAGICILNIAGGMGESPGQTAGFILIILAMLCSSFTGSVSKILLRNLSPFTLLFYSYLFAAVFFNGAGLIQAAASGSMGSYLQPLTHPWGIVTILYLASMPGISSTLIYYYCLKRAKVSVVVVFSYLTPVISMILASVFLQENITLLDIGCMILIIGSMAGSVFFGSRNKRQGEGTSSAADEKICERSV